MSNEKREVNQTQFMGPKRGGPRNFGPKEKPKNGKQILKRLLGYIASSKILLVSLIIIVIFYTLSNLYTNILVKNVVASLGSYNVDIKQFTIEPDEDKFKLSIILLGTFYVTYCVLQYLSSLLGAFLSTKMVRKMRNDMFGKIVKLPIKYVDTHAHGDIMSRMTNDVDNISNAVSQSITSLISGILMIVGCLGIMIWYSPLLTVISIAVLGLTLLLTKLMSKYMRPLFVSQQSILGKLNSKTEEMVTGSKTVIAYNREMKAISEFNELSEKYTKTGIKAQVIGGSMGPIMNFIGNIGYFLVSIFGSIFIIKGIGGSLLGEALTVSVVVMFLTTTKQFTRPINEIANLYSSLLSALAGAERVFSILDESIENLEIDSNALGLDNGDIEFNNVNFSYIENKQVLNDFNIHINKGNKIALVGATGSGKTTIVNLLLRFYEIDNGLITINKKNLSHISKNDIRKSISIVLQDPVLFNDSVENNIRYGRKDATDEEIDEVLRLARCEEFVNRLQNGKKTILTEGASNISQGERQLLTIARAILANPKILILDEATSSVDTRTEMKIQEALLELMKNRTSIIIAHRLSTIQDADKIVVLDHGHVVEEGNHESLLKQNGVYNRLYQTQFNGLET